MLLLIDQYNVLIHVYNQLCLATSTSLKSMSKLFLHSYIPVPSKDRKQHNCTLSWCQWDHCAFSIPCNIAIGLLELIQNTGFDSRLESYEHINRNVSLTLSKIRISNSRMSTNFTVKHFQPQSAFTAENWSTTYSCFKNHFHCIHCITMVKDAKLNRSVDNFNQSS